MLGENTPDTCARGCVNGVFFGWLTHRVNQVQSCTYRFVKIEVVGGNLEDSPSKAEPINREENFVRYFLLIPMLALLSACATPQMSQAQQDVRPISNTDNCAFVKTAYFEVSHPSKVHYYATQNVIDAGGDSYNIMSTGNDTAAGLGVHTVNIGIYKCAP